MKQFNLLKILLLLVTIVLPQGLMAYDFMADGIYYSINGDGETVSVTSKSLKGTPSYSGDITIPDMVSYGGMTYAVTTIGDCAFYYCSGLTSVIMPNSLTSINDEAFEFCSGLTSVTIPNSVRSLGMGPFAFCRSLTSVTIGNSVSSIGNLAFTYCDGLTSVTIPNSVTSIGYNAFEYCSGLTDIYAYIENPSSVSMGSNVFYNVPTSTCVLHVLNGTSDLYRAAAQWSTFTNIVEMAPPEHILFADAAVEQICLANWDSNGDGYLTKAEAAAVTNLGTVFKSNTTITSFDELQYFTGLTSIGSEAFYGCSDLTSVTIPNSVTSIGEGAFFECGGLTSVTIPNSVTSIGFCAFFECGGLTSVTIPNSVTTIGEGAFFECGGLTSVTIPNSVTSIGREAFKDCEQLTEITCEAETPPTLGDDAFDYSSDQKLKVPSGTVNAYRVADGWKNFYHIHVITPDPSWPKMYLTGSSFSCGWVQDDAIEMSTDDGNIYYYETEVLAATWFAFFKDSPAWSYQRGPASGNGSNPTGEWEATVAGGAWQFALGGNCRFEYNYSTNQARIMNDGSAVIVDDNTYYLIGDFNNWDVETQVAFTNNNGIHVLKKTFSGEFKIRDQLGNIYGGGATMYWFSPSNPGVTLDEEGSLYLQEEATYTLTIIGKQLTVSGFGTIETHAISGLVELVNSEDASVVYDGTKHCPAVRVIDDTHGELTLTTDYTLSYTNNQFPGVATITATGCGDYSGTLSTTFTITKAPMPNVEATVIPEDTDILYDGEPHPATLNATIVAGMGEVTISYVKDGVNQSTPPIEPGTYFVNISFTEGEYYLAGSVENAATFTIYALDEEDWESIKAIYNGTDGSNWVKTVDISDVKNARQLIDKGLATITQGRIVSLNLSNLGLIGDVPIEGVKLTALQSLDVSNNHLSGNIGSFVEPMTSLTSLKVNDNEFSDLYPPLSPNITNVILGKQVDITKIIVINLEDLDKDELIAQIPRIYLYSINNHDYSGEVKATISAPDNWVGTFMLSNGDFTYQGPSSTNAFKGESGTSYPLEFLNIESLANGVVTLMLTFGQGDADFNGTVNVVDLQAIINWIFCVYDNSRPFNWTAANVIADNRINVQDVVGEVNILLSSGSSGSPKRTVAVNTDSGLEQETPSMSEDLDIPDAYLFWRGGVLYLSCWKPVAALDITFNGDASWDLAKYGLVMGAKGNHIVAYSLSGGAIPAGETAIATTSGELFEVLNAKLSDADAHEVKLKVGNPSIITGLGDIKQNDVQVLAADGGRIVLKTSHPLPNAKWMIYAVNGSLIASGNEELIDAGAMTLSEGLEVGIYIVKVAVPNLPTYITKIAIIR